MHHSSSRSELFLFVCLSPADNSSWGPADGPSWFSVNPGWSRSEAQKPNHGEWKVRRWDRVSPAGLVFCCSRTSLLVKLKMCPRCRHSSINVWQTFKHFIFLSLFSLFRTQSLWTRYLGSIDLFKWFRLWRWSWQNEPEELSMMEETWMSCTICWWKDLLIDFYCLLTL